MKTLTIRSWHVLMAFGLFVMTLLLQVVHASPFGEGVYSANVPFGSAAAISISLSGAINLALTPSGQNFSGTGSHVITVTSTDVVGYKLYTNATTSTSMSNGTSTIPASANASAAPLAINSWGYNTSGSTTNFTGITTSQALLKSATGPFKNGDGTTVTYGAYINSTKSSGTYTVNVTYTAVGQG